MSSVSAFTFAGSISAACRPGVDRGLGLSCISDDWPTPRRLLAMSSATWPEPRHRAGRDSEVVSQAVSRVDPQLATRAAMLTRATQCPIFNERIMLSSCSLAEPAGVLAGHTK